MSNALSRLRIQFGDRLFERGAGAMFPTPRAMEAHAAMKESLAVIQSVAGHALDQLAGGDHVASQQG